MAIGGRIEIDFLPRLRLWSKHVWVIAGCCVLVFATDAAYPQCPQRQIQFSITKDQIAQIEQSQAEGHQPWRNNAKLVADSGLMQVEGGIDPRNVDSVPFKRKRFSAMREAYSYSLDTPSRRVLVTVRCFHWKDPTTSKTCTTVWWVTEIVIEDCGNREKK